MRHHVSGRKLSRPTGHRTLMYRNLVTDLLRYEKIVTTEAKAKEVQSMAERIITLGKGGTLHHRRQAVAFITDQKVATKLFDELAPRYVQRHGGYARIIKLGTRLGDGAHMAQLELLE